MNKTTAKIISLVISLIVFAIYWYITLPAFNLADFYFLGGVVLFAFVYYVALVLLTEDTDSVKSIPNIIVISIISIWAVGAIVLSIFASPMFQAKNYSDLIHVENKEFNTDFPNTDVNKLALLDKTSAVKIGNSLMGTQLIKNHNLKSPVSTDKLLSKMNPIVFLPLVTQASFVG